MLCLAFHTTHIQWTGFYVWRMGSQYKGIFNRFWNSSFHFKCVLFCVQKTLLAILNYRKCFLTKKIIVDYCWIILSPSCYFSHYLRFVKRYHGKHRSFRKEIALFSWFYIVSTKRFPTAQTYCQCPDEWPAKLPLSRSSLSTLGRKRLTSRKHLTQWPNSVKDISS